MSYETAAVFYYWQEFSIFNKLRLFLIVKKFNNNCVPRPIPILFGGGGYSGIASLPSFFRQWIRSTSAATVSSIGSFGWCGNTVDQQAKDHLQDTRFYLKWIKPAMSKTVIVIYNSSAIDFFPSLCLPLPAGIMGWHQLDAGFSKICLYRLSTSANRIIRVSHCNVFIFRQSESFNLNRLSGQVNLPSSTRKLPSCQLNHSKLLKASNILGVNG